MNLSENLWIMEPEFSRIPVNNFIFYIFQIHGESVRFRFCQVLLSQLTIVIDIYYLYIFFSLFVAVISSLLHNWFTSSRR